MKSVTKKRAIALLLAALLAACEQRDASADAPQTPQEMYERVRALLQPNVEHDTSEFAQALEWLQRAAEAGHLQAQTDLGGIYLEGGKGGLQPDGQKASHWFSMAAAQGSKEAMYYLGLIHYTGKDVPQDKQKALNYWQQAAEGGVAEAQFRLGVELAQAQTAEAVQQGVRWLTQAVGQAAAAPGVAAQAACSLGYIYASGKPGIAKNMTEAARWYKIAADGGDASAQLVYAIMLLQGEPVAKDEAQGLRYLRLAAGQDVPAAITLLVKMIRSGVDASSSPQEADAWEARLHMLQGGAN